MPDLETLRAELDAAVRAYAAARRPEDAGTLVDRWALVYQAVSDDLAERGVTSFDVAVPSGQDFVTTRGLLEVGIEWERSRVFRS